MALRATSGRMRAAAPAQRRAMSLLTRASCVQSSVSKRTLLLEGAAVQAVAQLGEVEDLALVQLRVGKAGEVGDASACRGSEPRRMWTRSTCSISRAVRPTASSTASGSSDSPMPLLRAASARASWL